MVDPGTALAIVGLVLDVSKDLYEYYSIWKGRDDDITQVRLGLLWLNRLFVAIRLTLMDANLAPDHKEMICQAIGSCRGVIQKLEKRLEKSKKEGTPTTLLEKLGDQARRAVYPFQRGTIARLAENIDDCKQHLHLVISLVNMDTTAKGLKELRELDQKVTSAAAVIDVIHKLVIEDHGEIEKQKVIDWLRPVYQSDLQAAAMRRHEVGTGEWFLGSTAFQSWRSKSGSLLWINGSVGCGKTVLFSSIVEQLEGNLRSQPGEYSMAYFYCLYRKGAQHSLAAILQSFIAQLCPRAHVPVPLRELYELHNKKFPPGIPSDSELKNTLLAIIKNPIPSNESPSLRTKIYLLIDALDEWPIGFERDELLSYLAELASYGIPHLHILVTSRDEPDIRDVLTSSNSWTDLLVSKEKVSADMRLYVTNEIEKHPRLSHKSPEIKDQIMKRLVTEGNGMFRWAALQMEAIKKLRPMIPQTITRALHSLPKDLNETYDKILSDFNEETLTALRWIAFATRPLLLEEFIDACVIKYSESSRIEHQFDAQARFMPSDVLELLPGLITIDPPLQAFETFLPGVHIVTFAHFSVQEYLLGDGIKAGPASKYSLEPRSSNHAIARDCLSYLRCCNLLPLQNDKYPLRGYAWDYWAWHAEFEERKSHEQIGSDAQSLFKSIVYQKPVDCEASLDRLLSSLSDVAAWHRISQSAKSELHNCLRIPFFYDEFNINTWQNISNSNISLREYKYQPLQEDRREIRLVELFPSPKTFTEIRCKMLTVSLDEKPRFDALSYVWGDPLQVGGYIRMDGLLLRIPSNLIDVLRDFRGKNKNDKRVLFADAICFNQYIVPEGRSNFEGRILPFRHSVRLLETETKIGLTPLIFKAAQQVAIGLGKRDEADAKAIEFIKEIASKPAKEGIDGEETDLPFAESHGIEIGSSVLQLFSRKWWLRSWPIQELILPSRATLYYGDMAVPFETFQKFFKMENELQKYLDAASYKALVTSKAWNAAKRISIIRSEYAQGRMPSLPELLWATQLHEALKARDKIHVAIALLLLDDQSERFLLQRSSDIDLFLRLSKYILAQNATIDILSYASCHTFPNLDAKNHFPSWVPNFNIAQTQPPLIYGCFGPHDNKDIYNAGKYDGPPDLKVSEDSKLLHVKGFQIDTVEVGYETFGYDNNTDVLEHYTKLAQVRTNMKLPPGQSNLEAYWRSIHLDQWDGLRLSSDSKGLVKDKLVTMERAIELAKSNKLFDLQHCKDRRFFITSTGLFGLGPAHLQAGDHIIVFPSGKVPYVLRDHGENYTLIGECYIHGMMDGEAMEALQKGNFTLRAFSLD